MSFTLHQDALNKLCRICGRLTTKAGNNISTTVCTKFIKEAQTALEINIWQDDPLIHHGHFCWRCARLMRHVASNSRNGASETTVVNWEKHSRTGNCKTCELYKSHCKVGRPVKHKRSGVGLPNRNTVNVSESESLHCLPISPYTSEKVPHNLDVLHSAAEASLFICAICQCILGLPTVQTLCEHNFCADCLLAWFQYRKNNNVPCPICNAQVNISDVTLCPRVLRVQLTTLPTVCSNCGTIGKLQSMKNHVCLQQTPQQTPKPKAAVCYLPTSPKKIQGHSETEATQAARLLKSMANKHVKGTPIPPEIEEAADRWTWLKLKQSPNIRLKTLGRVSTKLLKPLFACFIIRLLVNNHSLFIIPTSRME